MLALLIGSQSKGETKYLKTNCPLKLGIWSKTIVNNRNAINYAASITAFLVWEKTNDSILDDNNMLSRLLFRYSKENLERANTILAGSGFPFQKAIELRTRQNHIENSRGRINLQEATDPTAEVMGLIFAHTAKISGVESNIEPFFYIGDHTGRIITVIDACHDYLSDRKKKRFNAIAATLDDKWRWPIENDTYLEVKGFLLENLRQIHSHLNQLTLFHHEDLVHNVLGLGLYDSIAKACNILVKNKSPEPAVDTDMVCPSCGQSSVWQGKFCKNCGWFYLTKGE